MGETGTMPDNMPARHNTYDLAGRVALVTGALGGLGPAVVATLLAAGAQVVGMSHADRAEPLDDIERHAGIGPLSQVSRERLALRVAEAQDEASVAQLVGGIVAQYGRLDIAVNIVGGFAMGQPVSELDTAVWDHMQAINARSTFLVSKYAARPMQAQQWGRIVNIASRSAFAGRRNAAAYAVAKGAVITLTQAQAEELRDAHVTVNAVVPALFDTPANRAAMPHADTSRWPKPDEIARVIAFLASDDAALINGAAIPVYGLA